jgi:diguanylate cyclase (GGDEF)-like protein
LLPNTTSEHASIAAEHIRERIARLKVETARGPVGVTISAGVAEVLPADETIDPVIYRADLALYQAKTDGRNRTFLYSSHLPTQE